MSRCRWPIGGPGRPPGPAPRARREPVQLGQRPGHRQPELRARPQTAVCGNARWTMRRAPPGEPWKAEKSLGEPAARAASGPSAARSRGAGAASSSSDGDGTAAPRPPNRRPSAPRRSSTPKWSRAAASTKTLSRPDILGQHRHRLPLARAGGLVHDHLQPGVLRPDLSAGIRWVRVARIAASSTAWRARLKPRNSRRGPGAPPGSRCASAAAYRRSPPPRARARSRRPPARRPAPPPRGPGELRAADRPLREQHDVVGQVDHGHAGSRHVPERGRLEKGLEDDALLAPLHAHGREVDRAVRGHRRHDGFDDHRTRSTGGGLEASVALGSRSRAPARHPPRAVPPAATRARRAGSGRPAGSRARSAPTRDGTARRRPDAVACWTAMISPSSDVAVTSSSAGTEAGAITSEW